MSYLPRAVTQKRGMTRQRRIDDLNARLLGEYRVLLACATHCDAMRLKGLRAATEGDARARAILNSAQDIVTTIESLGGTPAYQVKDFGI